MERHSILKGKDLLVVFLEGEIVSRSYPEFEKKLMGDMESRRNVLFNMEKVDFVASQGGAFLLRMRNLIDVNGGYFSIYNLNPNVERVLKRLQLEKVLNVTSDVEKCFNKLCQFDDRERMCHTVP